MSDIRDVVVPLYERRGPVWKGLGTASIIAAHGQCAIALTARHVLEAIVGEITSVKPTYPKLSRVHAIIGPAERSFVAEVHQVQASDFSDIALAILLAPDGCQFGPRLSIDPGPVAPGIQVLPVGYRGLPTKNEIDWEKEHFAVRLEFRLNASEATVSERRAEGVRRLKWPVFKVSGSFDSAMSGGPILETRGTEPTIRGVICSDMTHGSDGALGGGGEAWSSEIWPILMMPYRFDVEFSDEGGQDLKVSTILDLFKNELLLDRGDTVRHFLWEIRDGLEFASWQGYPEILVGSKGT